MGKYKTLFGGLRREAKLIPLSSKSSPRLTHPTKYKILLSPQVRMSQSFYQYVHPIY
jgi:hypothetical protein